MVKGSEVGSGPHPPIPKNQGSTPQREKVRGGPLTTEKISKNVGEIFQML